MPSIIRLIPHYCQPQSAAKIDLSNPLGRSVVDAFLPLSLHNKTTVRNFIPSVSAGAAISAVGLLGRKVSLADGTSNGGLIIAADGDDLFPSATETTIFVIRRSADTTARASTLFGYDGAETGLDRVLVHAPWSDGNIYFDYGTADAANRISVAFTKSTTVDYLVFVAGGGKGREIWRNRVKIAGDTTRTGSRAATGAGFRIGAASPGYFADSEEVYLFGTARRAWSDSEIASWFNNPWQIFEPIEEESFYAAASGVAALAGAAAVTAAAAAALSVSVPLAGASITTATASGALSISIPLATAATAMANASGGLSLAIPLSGSAVAQALAQAGITQATPLAGAAVAQALAAAGLSINVSLSGAAIAQAAAAAGLTVDTSGLAGNAAAQASATAALSIGIPLTGAALTVASASGGITKIVPLTGSAAAASIATGGLDVSVQLSGAALAQALASAGLTVATSGLAGSAAATASASGAITLRVNLAGTAVVNAIAAGALASDGALSPTPGWSISATPRTWSISATPRTWSISATPRTWSISATPAPGV